MPAPNFAYHCETTVSAEYPFLLRCPKIEDGIKEGQRRGKKVIMSIGGATGDGTLLLIRPESLQECCTGCFLGAAETKQYNHLESMIHNEFFNKPVNWEPFSSA